MPLKRSELYGSVHPRRAPGGGMARPKMISGKSSIKKKGMDKKKPNVKVSVKR